MEIKIDIDNDFCDEIVAHRLIQTSKALKKDIKDKTWGEEDLKQFQEVVDALEIVGPWFVYMWEKKTK
jgi:L-ribulose-5-phosphate 3-epimerase UlaE